MKPTSLIILFFSLISTAYTMPLPTRTLYVNTVYCHVGNPEETITFRYHGEVDYVGNRLDEDEDQVLKIKWINNRIFQITSLGTFTILSDRGDTISYSHWRLRDYFSPTYCR